MVVFSSAGLAAPDLEAVQRCAGISDSLQRLVCYDKAVASADTPAGPAAPAVAAIPELGQEQLEQSTSGRKEAPASLDARVSSLQSLPWDLVRVTLDNGQIWQTQEANVRFNVAVGDAIRIKKGAMGSYRMARVSNGNSGWVSVKRVQ